MSKGACGVMEDLAAKLSFLLKLQGSPGTSLHTGAHTGHPALTAKTSQGRDLLLGKGCRQATPVPSLGWGAGRGSC